MKRLVTIIAVCAAVLAAVIVTGPVHAGPVVELPPLVAYPGSCYTATGSTYFMGYCSTGSGYYMLTGTCQNSKGRWVNTASPIRRVGDGRMARAYCPSGYRPIGWTKRLYRWS